MSDGHSGVATADVKCDLLHSLQYCRLRPAPEGGGVVAEVAFVGAGEGELGTHATARGDGFEWEIG